MTKSVVQIQILHPKKGHALSCTCFSNHILQLRRSAMTQNTSVLSPSNSPSITPTAAAAAITRRLGAPSTLTTVSASRPLQFPSNRFHLYRSSVSPLLCTGDSHLFPNFVVFRIPGVSPLSLFTGLLLSNRKNRVKQDI